MTPQLIMIFIYCFGLGIAAARHGQPRKGSDSFWLQLVATILGQAVLYWGGFYDVFF